MRCCKSVNPVICAYSGGVRSSHVLECFISKGHCLDSVRIKHNVSKFTSVSLSRTRVLGFHGFMLTHTHTHLELCTPADEDHMSAQLLLL